MVDTRHRYIQIELMLICIAFRTGMFNVCISVGFSLMDGAN